MNYELYLILYSNNKNYVIKNHVTYRCHSKILSINHNIHFTGIFITFSNIYS